MIPATDLRIGNKFKSIFGNTETVLSIIDNTNNGKIKVLTPEEYKAGNPGYASEAHRLQYSHLILCEENGNQYKPLEISGVQLTNEWLIKGGWDKKSAAGLYFKLNCCIWYENKKYKYSNHDSEVIIDFVHELQNLHKDLTKQAIIFTK